MFPKSNVSIKTTAHPILYVVTVLLALNLVVTTALLFDRKTEGQSARGERQITGLPAYLTHDEIKSLSDRVIRPYNERDVDTLYSEFDEVVKAELSKEDLASALEKLHALAGTIAEATYVDFTDLASQGQPGNYVLNFSVTVSNSDFNASSMTITVFDRGDRYGLVGFFLSP